ncbi:serine/threonine-protein kinase mTOR-like [Ostrea edulis]|uniref:serine/threonine-protein kinase mTOR-like n=1 Tax=Ostrea edulis TaxID=37623 RepID=UPI0024AEA6CB|nr:serine/threonine-protein kinase mTOR-like [Ostrea edulis]XP_048736868.2 serine/threonine-protein kinase mTOR-like [Ostrea edulis]XP_048736875.2 serine/threonine-protein kinase mTOR-like [Ostrea edulis]XP_048736883.2 serine/threonine-protein kinase mTOR-like [Ostrea edulis]XP_048736892.2 serine/threonine-protein kinase mTOR-like [Ostrea edulis]XP_048736900.2 serine/threonine-protein kinase mTOR-like [Ostrea edulis]XP_056008567.1 serine/threonine-protein kinase mTOR-like [Ostrea edulis]XP_0
MAQHLQEIISQFVTSLKNKNEDVRNKAAMDLYRFVVTELREMPSEYHTTFMDKFNHFIFEMVSSSDMNERKGGILAIVSLTGVDVGNTSTRISRFSNYLRNLLPSNDVSVMEMAARAVGWLAYSSGSYAAEYVEHEVKRGLEWLTGDRQESKRLAAVLVLKELAVNTPTFFFQQVQQFFDCIFNAVRDPKPNIREGAVAALRGALAVTSQRESKATQKAQWYKQCYDEAMKLFDETQGRERKLSRDDWAHGSLLILNELLRCSNIEGERLRMEMEDITTQQYRHERTLKEMSKTHKSPSSSLTLQQFQQKAFPINNFMSGNRQNQQKISFESRTCKQLVESHFDKVCALLLRHKNSKSVHIQLILQVIFPRLAAFRSQEFSKLYLDETISFLLGSLKTTRDKTATFQAIGLLAISVQDNIVKYLPGILEVVRASLPPKDLPAKKQKNIVVDPTVFTCISMLARAVGPAMIKDVRDLLDSMFATGLSPALTAALRDLAIQIPQLKKEIQEGLLKNLSLILMGRQLRHPGAPKSPLQSLPLSASLTNLVDVQDATSITLALKTLGSFDFEGHSLTQFVQHCAEQYLSSDHKEIRMEAVRTCARLLTPLLQLLANSQGQISIAAMNTVAEVLHKLLVVGITDTDSDIRYCVLVSMDDRFDPHLAQAENLSALFVALNDEVFEIRELAICIIGRLSSKNPAYVMPSLRKTLIQIRTELEYSGVGRNKEQAAKMLGHLVANAARLVRPYMEPILNALIPKLKEPDPNPNVTISVLVAIGEQAQVSGIEMRKWMDELLPLILEMLQDSSSLQKREVALWTLGQLVESTGYVIEPYKRYPSLLEVLLNFLKTEQATGIRREVIRVLGLLGALDPHKHKMNQGVIQRTETNAVSMSETKLTSDNTQPENTSEMLANMSASTTLEEIYPAIAIATLMRIIRDGSLSQHHTMVVQAITFIFKSLGIKCVPYIQQVIPAYLAVIRSADQTFREFLFQQLGVIIAIVKQHIRNYLDDIFAIVKEYWSPNSTMQNTIINLVEQIVTALGTEFRIYLPQIIPQILKVFMQDSSENRAVTGKLLNALQLFGANLDDYLHLLLPPVVKLFDSPDVPLSVKRTALETVDKLTFTLDLTDFASRIIHPLVRTLDSVPELQSTAMDTLCAMVMQMGPKFTIFIPMVQRVIQKHKIAHQRYFILMARILKASTIAEEEDDPILLKHRKNRGKASESSDSLAETAVIKKLHVSFTNLQKALEAGRKESKEDWMEWLRRLSIELLKESPSPALRSCWALAQTYNSLAKDLFNAAFVSCWTELTEAQQDELILSLEQALTSQDIPEITQTLLNLAEFMEHCDKGPLPLDTSLLGSRAMKCRAYAKALHYKEEEFHRGPTTATLESLISINNKLQQPESASGVLQYAQNHRTDVRVQESWYEKLHEWNKALEAYEKKQEERSEDFSLTLGRMRCLEALAEWGQLHQIACEKWGTSSDENRTNMARMAASAAWGLGQWDSMEEYMCLIPRNSYNGAFYRAVFALHTENYQLAQQCIDKARDILDTELTAMAGESYNRAYGAMVNVQMLSELEEVMQFKLVPERQEAIKQMWWDRLQGCQRVVEDWQKIIQVRSLVVSPLEDMKTWLKYASLCRKSGRLALSNKTLVMLLGMDPAKSPDNPIPTTNPQVTFAYLKHMWKNNQKTEAYSKLQHFVQHSLQTRALQLITPEDTQQRSQLNRLLARCYLKLGDWAETLDRVNEDSVTQILEYYSLATEYDKYWYKAWHGWALINYEAVLFYKQSEKTGTHPQSPGDIGSMRGDAPLSPKTDTSVSTTSKMHKYCVLAVQGFFRSISLSQHKSLQDTLRLLTLMFDYGQWLEVYEALNEGIKTIQVENWLQVIPQLIARIDIPRPLVSRLINQLLIDIGKAHPQALIYPLTVASKSNVPARQTAANKILKNMCEHSNTLVQQAMLVSEELIRVAILWHELWHEGLEEASRLYFGERDIKGMFSTLEPLHNMVERGPQTLKETSFNQAYGRDLMEAQEWCRKYQRSENVKDLTQAWDLYYHVFRRISKQLPQLTSLELQYVSPKLLRCQELELAVPGKYEPNQPIDKIRRCQSSLQVITSKQRPRKLSIFGSSGLEYMFLLKGHEDLRQDERVMQLFSLVNSLLVENPETFRRNLTIQRFSVIPLSTNSGLIGWVPHTDTLHSLIRDYREKKKILLNIEHRLMLRMAPDYDHLTLMQKVEVFEHALEHTQGDDLAKILWYKSPSSEVWFDRRTNYTRSLAVMSMVGYVLGLGDRHPSNLMLDRTSGKVIHIDFGDCFEVAMVREKFPEKIPFRLTRMLINAMEVTGIDGNYKMTCESVMDVLREHKDSLMAVLEAFVYDPLLNWRLMDTTAKGKTKTKDSYSGGSQEQTDMLENVDLSQATHKRSAPEAVSSINGENFQSEVINKKALSIINRVRDKLTGRDFSSGDAIDVPTQVELLIKQATSHENLCQCYIGWCPFW